MEKVIKRGFLDVLKDPSWTSRYFLLYSKDSTTLARLDWYDAELDHKLTPGKRKTLYIQDIHQLHIGESVISGKSHTFVINSGEAESTTYAADSASQVQDWVSSINSLRPDMVEKQRKLAVRNPAKSRDGNSQNNNMAATTATLPAALKYTLNGAAIGGMTMPIGKSHTLSPEMQMQPNSFYGCSGGSKYPIVVQDTDGSEKCGLKMDTEGLYELHVGVREMSLVQTAKQETKLAWPYRFIRRYGRTTSSFTFEAGRKCDTGEGLFTFKVNDGELVFNEVHLKTKAMKTQTDTPPLTESPTPGRALPATPTSPPVGGPAPLPPSGSPQYGHPPQLPDRKYGDTMAKELEAKQKKHSPTTDSHRTPVIVTPVGEKPQPKAKHSHGVKDAIKGVTKHVKEEFRHFGDHISDTLHIHDRRSRGGSTEDLTNSKPRTSLGVDDVDGGEIFGTIGKFSPNMKQRVLPAIPFDAKSSHKPDTPQKKPLVSQDSEHIYEDTLAFEKTNDVFPPLGHQYDLYDPEFSSSLNKPKAKAGSASSDLYEEKPQCDSGLGTEYMMAGSISLPGPPLPHGPTGGNKTKLLSTKSVESGYTEDDEERFYSVGEGEQYYSVPEGGQNFSEAAATGSIRNNTDDYADPATFKMSSILPAAKQQGQDTFQEDYAYTYGSDYDSINFVNANRKDGPGTVGKTDSSQSQLAEQDDGTYGMLSLGFQNIEEKVDVGYINTSKMTDLNT